MAITTIQVDENVLALLQKLKQEYKASSYGEVIVKTLNNNQKNKSLAGYLGNLLSKKEKGEIMHDDRRDSERF